MADAAINVVSRIQNWFNQGSETMVSKALDVAIPIFESSTWGNKVKGSIGYVYKSSLLYSVAFKFGYVTSSLYFTSNKIFSYLLIDCKNDKITLFVDGVKKLVDVIFQIVGKISLLVKQPVVDLTPMKQYLCKFIYHFCFMMLGTTDLKQFSLILVQKLLVRSVSLIFLGVFWGMGFSQIPIVLGLYVIWYTSAYIALTILKVVYPNYNPQNESFLKLVKNFWEKEAYQKLSGSFNS